MVKIGRNEKCPCRSGKKFKHCCGLRERDHQDSREMSPGKKAGVTLMDAVGEIQDDGVAQKAMCRELGVFFLYSTAAGDAWLLEMTQSDCVQVVQKGIALKVPIDEKGDTIEINWSHLYILRDKKFEITAYADKSIQVVADAPSREINAAMRRIRKKYSSEQLEKVHVAAPEHATKQ